jgi:hypothetical protein
MRNGARIGTHEVGFSTSGDTMTASIAVEMSIGWGPIRFFRYRLHAVEIWKGGAFVSLEARTDDDGEPAFCIMHRTATSVLVSGSKAPDYAAPSSALPATHWNVAELKGAMVNPENGKLYQPAVSDLGPGTVMLASGLALPAHHYALRGTDPLDLWYDAQNTWAGLSAVVKDGSTLVYERA